METKECPMKSRMSQCKEGECMHTDSFVEDTLASFKKKFVRESVFGVTIGAIDSFAGKGEQQVFDFLHTALTEAIYHGKVKMAERAITLYQVALGDTQLPEEVWKKIASANRSIIQETK